MFRGHPLLSYVYLQPFPRALFPSPEVTASPTSGNWGVGAPSLLYTRAPTCGHMSAKPMSEPETTSQTLFALLTLRSPSCLLQVPQGQAPLVGAVLCGFHCQQRSETRRPRCRAPGRFQRQTDTPGRGSLARASRGLCSIISRRIPEGKESSHAKALRWDRAPSGETWGDPGCLNAAGKLGASGPVWAGEAVGKVLERTRRSRLWGLEWDQKCPAPSPGIHGPQ